MSDPFASLKSIKPSAAPKSREKSTEIETQKTITAIAEHHGFTPDVSPQTRRYVRPPGFVPPQSVAFSMRLPVDSMNRFMEFVQDEKYRFKSQREAFEYLLKLIPKK